MKKIVLLLILGSLFSSAPIIASSSPSSSSSNVYPMTHAFFAPQSRGGFFIGVTGLYLQPSANDALNINSTQFTNTSGTEFTSRLLKFDPKYQWGYGIKAGYDFPFSSNDITVEYKHLNTRDKLGENNATTNAITSANYFVPNFMEIHAADPAAITQHVLKYHFNQVDLTAGRLYVDSVSYLKIHPALGLRYTDLKYDTSTVKQGPFMATSTGPTAPLFAFQELISQFQGLGPIFKVDVEYPIIADFAIIGGFNSSLLVGNIKSTQEFTIDVSAPINISDHNHFHNRNTRRVATSLEGKLGVNYNHCFTNHSRLALEVGYQVSKYHDAIDLLIGNIQLPATITPAQRITQVQSNNFTLNGPYANLTFYM